MKNNSFEMISLDDAKSDAKSALQELLQHYGQQVKPGGKFLLFQELNLITPSMENSIDF